LDVDDIITFHGESVDEFESNFQTVVDDYIAACEKLGAAPEKPASGRLMLRVSPTVHAAALKAAARKDVSLNKWAEQALRIATARVVPKEDHVTGPEPDKALQTDKANLSCPCIRKSHASLPLPLSLVVGHPRGERR
jgi:predicted HicB family RNase H-like nuclease